MAFARSTETSGNRKCRKRSRFGCRNCKLRRVKCDEEKPQCKKCVSFGVLCTFEHNVSDLQPVTAHAGKASVLEAKHELCPSLTDVVWTHDVLSSYRYRLDVRCQDFLNRYLGHSLISPDNPLMVQVNRSLLSMTFNNPHLMHSSLAVAFTYDRYLNGRAGSHRTPEECYHWHQGTALLSDRLKRPIEPKAKDAIWGTTAALAMLTVSSPDANSPEDSWPLQSVDGSELDWLCMLNGKMSLWSVFDPLRPDSIFRVLTMTYAQMHSPLPRQGIQGISPSIAELCELDHFSTAETSPYFLAAHAVSQLLIRPDEEVTVGDIPVFTQTVHGSFESLLRARDPIALLLLYLWYRKSGRNIWWIALRAKVECPAIRLYLEWYHKDHAEVHALLALDRPAAICT